MKKANRIVTEPAIEPVSLDEMKAHARIDDASDETLIEGLIKAARHWCEHYTRRVFITQGWQMSLAEAPSLRSVSFPSAPLLGVTAVRAYSDDGQAEVLDAQNYYIDTLSLPGRLVLHDGVTWPEATRPANAYVIDYSAGYGPSAGDVPEAIRLAIKQLTLHWYENRGEAMQGSNIQMAPLTVTALLAPFRILTAGGACE